MSRVFAELTSLPVVAHDDGSFTLTKKFIEGMNHYVAHWDGPVVAVMDPVHAATDNLDNVRVDPKDIDFEIKAIQFESEELRNLASQSGFVHWGPHYKTHDLADIVGPRQIANVYNTEYSLKTRLQIVDETAPNLLKRWRRRWWERGQERLIRRSIAAAAGFEANGTPTYDAYAALNDRNLLYFASWVKQSALIAEHELEQRLAASSDSKAALRLVFSGRLNEMKGAMDLIVVADMLRRRGLNFKLSICGGGVLEDAMRQRIARDDLGNHVTMMGVLPFQEKLVPFVKQQADLFLCCHKQGDPSSTYLETFALGVPIAGYGNEALAGLIKRVDAGWCVGENDAAGLADTVVKIAGNRAEIARKSRTALAFARQHTFEQTFARRMDFFKQVAARKRTG